MNPENQKYIDMIDDMRDDEEYEFAEDTLKSIREYAAKNHYLTDGQMAAVDNILNSKPYSATFHDWRD